MKKTYLLLFTFLIILSNSFSQQTSEGFIFNGENRTYLVYIPTTYNSVTDNLPLVLALHGLGGTKEGFSNSNGFKALAESEKFILVTPQAQDPTESITVPFLGLVQASDYLERAWHSGAGGDSYTFNSIPVTLPTSYYASETRDDVGFLSSLIDSISNQYNVDSNRVYSTGYSMGGFMTNRLACELSDKIAAIASVAGTIGNEIKNTCNPNAVIPALHIHSTTDQTVQYNNNNWGMDAKENAAFWVNNNNCNIGADTTDFTSVVSDGFTSQKLLYNMGDSASEVEVYHLEGPQHNETWYGASRDFSASAVIWEFFSRHEKVRVIEEELEPNAISENAIRSLDIYPNPTYGKSTLGFKNKVPIQSIQITNAIGKTILNKHFTNNINSFTFDLTTQSKGIYFVRIEDYSGNKTVRRVIKK